MHIPGASLTTDGAGGEDQISNPAPIREASALCHLPPIPPRTRARLRLVPCNPANLRLSPMMNSRDAASTVRGNRPAPHAGFHHNVRER